MIGSYAKLKDGSWGVRVKGARKAKVGDHIEVLTKAGKRSYETVTAVLWSGADRDDQSKTCSLCAVEQVDSDFRSSSSSSRGTCMNCGEGRAVVEATDMSGCVGKVCRMCAREPMGISFG